MGIPSMPSGRRDGIGPYDPSLLFRKRRCVLGVPACQPHSPGCEREGREGSRGVHRRGEKYLLSLLGDRTSVVQNPLSPSYRHPQVPTTTWREMHRNQPLRANNFMSRSSLNYRHPGQTNQLLEQPRKTDVFYKASRKPLGQNLTYPKQLRQAPLAGKEGESQETHCCLKHDPAVSENKWGPRLS